MVFRTLEASCSAACARLVRRALAAFCILGLTGCRATSTGTVSPDGGVPFSVSSIRSSYGIQGRFTGTIAVQDRWVYVVVPTGAVRTYQLDRQDYWDLRLRAGLASCKPGGFEIISEGRAARLAPLLGLSRDAATLDTTTRAFRDTLRLDVGIPAGTDPGRSWIALTFEWPFQNVMATYTIHTNVPLNGRDGPWTGREADAPGERCR